MAKERGDVVHGTLDMLVLKALQLEPMHGWGSEWKVTENNRRARYYALTRAGRQHFHDELAQWRRVSRAVNLVLEASVNT